MPDMKPTTKDSCDSPALRQSGCICVDITSLVQIVFACVCGVAVAISAVAEQAADENSEAAVVFDGKKPAEMKGGTWKVVYSSAEGPEGRALEVLTERYGASFLREGHTTTALVLPLERDGGEPVKGKRDVLVLGRPSENATLRRFLKDGDVPKGGYLIRTFHREGRNWVLLAGDTPEAVL